MSILGCALFLGQRDLTRLAVVVLALPVMSLILIGRPRLAVTRTAPGRVSVGDSASVHLTIGNDGPRLDGALLADPIPEAVGATARFSLATLPAGQSRTVNYTIVPTRRGRHILGPLRVSTTEPLGLATVTRSVGTATDLTVYPAVVPLQQYLPGATRDVGSDVSSQVAQSGNHSMSVREYRRGDDLRRVHWRSTARRGELMVRADEHSTTQHATVLLDNRFIAHQRATGGTAGFEMAVSLTASICESLVEQGFHVTLLTQDSTGMPIAYEDAHLEALATIGLTRESGPLARLVAAAPDRPGPLIAIVGSLDTDDAVSLRALGGSRRLLFHRPPTPEPSDDGWLSASLLPGMTVSQAWQQVSGVMT